MPTLNIESLGATCINVVTIVLVGERLPYRNRIDATLQQGSQGVIGLIIACGMGKHVCCGCMSRYLFHHKSQARRKLPPDRWSTR